MIDDCFDIGYDAMSLSNYLLNNIVLDKSSILVAI